MKPVHILIVLLGTTLVGISMFVVAVLIQIILMPDLSQTGLSIYYAIWVLFLAYIAKRIIFRRR